LNIAGSALVRKSIEVMRDSGCQEVSFAIESSRMMVEHLSFLAHLSRSGYKKYLFKKTLLQGADERDRVKFAKPSKCPKKLLME
jgi:hypothetical protein